MSDELAVLFAKRFVQRRDVKAVQMIVKNKVIYMPDRNMEHPGLYGPVGFKMQHLQQHLAGQATYGHYMLDANDEARLFAFDVDLKKTGFYVPMTPFRDGMVEQEWEAENQPIALGDPLDPKDNSLREAWLNRAHPSRAFLKTQMGMLARKLVSSIQENLGIPCAASYSGHKGIHVYGFTGPMPAVQVRAAAHFALEATDDWELERGQHIYKHRIQDPVMGYPNFNIEVYPKQDSLDDKDLGNLMRLPMGRNLQAKDPAFFLDLTTPPGVMAPHPNPVRLLEAGNPYE